MQFNFKRKKKVAQLMQLGMKIRVKKEPKQVK